MRLTEQNFQLAVKYGGIAMIVGVVLSMYMVMRNVELFRDLSRAEQQFQQITLKQQIMQGLLQELQMHAVTNAQAAEVFRKSQAAAQAASRPATTKEPNP